MCSAKRNISEAYIVPWALPNEDVPLRVSWPQTEKIDEIRMVLPDHIKLVDVLNVDEVKTENGLVLIKPRFSVNDFSNYFGAIVSSSKISNELKVSDQIRIEMLHENRLIESHELDVRIFRPCLEVVGSPETIELLDGQRTKTLPLHLKYEGFGDIQLKIEVTIEGRIVSHGESIIYELLRRLWVSGTLENDNDKQKMNEKETKKEIWIAPEYIKQMSEEIQRRLETGTIPTEEIDAEAIEEMKHWLSDVKNQEKLNEILYSRVEDILLSLLIDLFEKYPSDNVKLSDAQTTIRTKIQTPIQTMSLKIRYMDLIKNEYPPAEATIKIVDNRKDELGFFINIPIVIERLEDKPFLNVKDMKIDERRE